MATPPYTMGKSRWGYVLEQLKASRVQLAATQTQLADTQAKLADTQAQLTDAQAQLADAQAQAQAEQQQAQQREQQPAQQPEEPVENNLQELVSDESDAADFLLNNSKYHDCFLTVGNPETDKVERIGVTSSYLIASSLVFRKMLGSYKQADLPNAKIIVSDVSPATFKLMLRYLYGGDLPKMTAVETAGLALCAEKYKITRLVRKTVKRLNPTSAEDVFPALICVTFTWLPDLEVQVSKIIQRETDKVVQSDDFLQLDEACVIFMLKQDTLNIDEVELWKHVVRWAEHQVEINPARTVRDCLAKILGYVRLLTFTSEEIWKHVLPIEAVTPEEFVDLARAVTNKQPVESSLLSKVQEKRNVYQEGEVNAESTLGETENKTEDGVSALQNKSETINCKTKDTSSSYENKPESTVLNKSCVFRVSDYFKLELQDEVDYNDSSLIIMPSELIEIESFTCKIPNDQFQGYNYICNITITKTERNVDVYKQEVCVEGSPLCDDEIVLPLKFNSGLPIVMKPGEKWSFTLNWSDWDFALSVNYLPASDDTWGDIEVMSIPLEGEDMTVFYETPFHILQVAYRKQ